MARKKPSVQDVEFAIADTADRAKSMLDDEGNLRGEEEYLKLLTVDTVFRPVKPSDRTNPRPGLGFKSWRGKLMVYDTNLAAGFMAGAKSGDYVCGSSRSQCSRTSAQRDKSHNRQQPSQLYDRSFV